MFKKSSLNIVVTIWYQVEHVDERSDQRCWKSGPSRFKLKEISWKVNSKCPVQQFKGYELGQGETSRHRKRSDKC